MKSLLWMAAGCVFVVNAWVLGKVALNQALGEPTILLLTERELVSSGTRAHDSIRSLSLVWQGNQSDDYLGLGYGSNRVRLTQDSYNTLGQGESLCNSDFKHRKAWVLLEYGGDAFAQLEKQYQSRVDELARKVAANDVVDEDDQNRLQRARENLQSQQQGGTRLVAVDVARERSVLEAKGEASGQPYLTIPVSFYPIDKCESTNVMVVARDRQRLYLAQRYAQALGDTPRLRQFGKVWREPRYQVELAYGVLGIPWVKSLAACQGPCGD